MIKKSKPLLLQSLSVFHYMAALIIFGIVFFLIFAFSRSQKTIYIDLSFFTPEWSTTVVPPDFTITNAIDEGNVAYDSFGKPTAVVIEKKTIDWAGTTRLISMVVQIKAYYNTRTKQYSYKDNPLLIGNRLILNIGNVNFNGKIINIYAEPTERYAKYKKRNVVVSLLLRNRELFWAEALKAFEAKNSKGETIARALNVSIRPAEIDVPTDLGTIQKGLSTIYKDVTLDLTLYDVLCAENSCYFNNTVDLKIGGENFYVQSNNTYISNGKIVNIKYEDDESFPR